MKKELQVRILFLIVLFIVFISLLIQRLMEKNKKKIVSIFFLLIGSIVVIAVASLRNNIGDTYVYVNSYSNLINIKSIQDLMQEKDIGFKIFTLMLYQISSNPQFMIFTTAFITQLNYLKFFYRYRSLIELEVFIYIASGYYLVTMNGIRQAFAAAILVCATKYMIDREFWKYFLVIILASFFHQSALIMIPVYFIVNMEPWKKNTFIIIGIAMIGFLFFFTFLPILFKFLEHTQYAHYFEIIKEGTEQGANPLRLLVAIVPLVLSYIKRESLKQWDGNKVFVNISIINFIFMLFSLHTWIFARFAMYFNLYNCVLLPNIIKRWENRKEKNLLYAFLILCYFIFFLREHGGIIYGTNYGIQELFYSVRQY